MRTLGTDILVHRGETFSIDILLQNPNKSPYIVTDRSANPYFLLTVSSSKYSQKGRYIKNWWLEIPKELRFYCTNPVDISEFDKSNGKNYAIYYDSETKSYYTWDGESDKPDVPYELRIVKTFSKEDTEQWVGQDYVYSITYVDGQSMLENLTELYLFEGLPEPVPTEKELLYLELVKKNDMYKDIMWERELSRIDISIPIINPSKLSVNSVIRGGII